MIRKTHFILLFCFFVMTLGLSSVNAQTKTADEEVQLSNTELKLNNNSTVRISDLKGKVVLLDFWYRGCFPCLKAIPELIKLQEEFKNELVIIGINDRDDQEDVTGYFEYKGTNYFSTYKTSNNISKNAKVTTFPTTILYDKQGEVVQVETGYSKGGVRSLRKAIRAALR